MANSPRSVNDLELAGLACGIKSVLFVIHPKTNEVCFTKHFDQDGNPNETLIKAKRVRLDNWHTLQELAGII